MIAVLQRVSRASVEVDGSVVGRCGKGLCVLLGVASGDSTADADALVRKIVNLRIFDDENGKTNSAYVVGVRAEVHDSDVRSSGAPEADNIQFFVGRAESLLHVRVVEAGVCAH